MTALARAARHETMRLVRDPRWFALAAVMVVAAVLAAGDVAAQVDNMGLGAAAFDVHAAVTNNLMYTGYLVFTAFIFLVGDSVIADVRSGYASLVLTRTSSPIIWWLSKLCAVLVAALSAQVMYLAISLVVGRSWQGLVITRTPSVLATASRDLPGAFLFPRVESADMLARQAGVALYLVLTFTTLASVLIALTMRVTKRSVPLTLALLGLMADYFMMKVWDGWLVVSPGLRLMEGAHAAGLADHAPPMWSSVVYFAVLLVVAIAVGVRKSHQIVA